MAVALASRGGWSDRALSITRLSFGFLRSVSTAATSPDAGSSSSAAKKPQRKNMFEVAQFLPKWGIGYHMAKTHWTSVFYEITKINLYKDGRYGKTWGLVHKDGLPAADAPKKISGAHKRYLEAQQQHQPKLLLRLNHKQHDLCQSLWF